MPSTTLDIFKTATTSLDNRKYYDYLARFKLATENMNDDDLKTFIEVVMEDYDVDTRMFSMRIDLEVMYGAKLNNVTLSAIRLLIKFAISFIRSI